jgi:hypothetical protein
MMGVSVAAAKGRLFHGRRALRKALRPEQTSTGGQAAIFDAVAREHEQNSSNRRDSGFGVRSLAGPSRSPRNRKLAGATGIETNRIDDCAYHQRQQLRHSDPRITLGIYGHVIGNQQRDAVENRTALIAQYAA